MATEQSNIQKMLSGPLEGVKSWRQRKGASVKCHPNMLLFFSPLHFSLCLTVEIGWRELGSKTPLLELEVLGIILKGK